MTLTGNALMQAIAASVKKDPVTGDDLLNHYMTEFGPWDANRTVTIPMIRRERLVALVKKINEAGRGTAKIVKITFLHEAHEEYIDGRVEFTVNAVADAAAADAE
jgi:hypothetical protein